MTVDTHVTEALARVEAEREHVAEKRAAFERCADEIRAIDPVSTGDALDSVTMADGGARATPSAVQRDAARPERTARVRAVLAETLPPLDASEPGSPIARIRDALGDDVAIALAPNGGGRFTSDVKAAVCSAIATRQHELRAMERALDVEAASLCEARDGIQATIDWLTDADTTPLSELGFDALRRRHETLADHRDRCDRLVDDRQAVLHGTTSHGAAAGIAHRSLVEHLYGAWSTSYPVLETVARLEECCEDCQRVVRAHLVRRA